MKTFQKYLIATLVAALTFPLAPAPKAEAFNPTDFLDAPQGVGNALGAVSTDVGLLIKYVGTSPAGGVVTVDAATGDITLETGVVGTVVADATTECPVSGALGGIIDVSNAACNTLGEVADAINASPNWIAVIVDGLRSDSADNTLITKAATSAAVAKGVPLLKDTTIALNVSIALIPVEARTDIRPWLNDGGVVLNPNPFADSQTYFTNASGTFTGTGADFFDVISVKVLNKDGGPAVASTAASIISTSSETVTNLYTTIGGTTTVNKEYTFQNAPIIGRRGEKVLLRLRAATTFTAAVFSGVGTFGTFKKSQ